MRRTTAFHLTAFFSVCLLTTLLPVRVTAGQTNGKHDSVAFGYPLRIPPEISGSFAELRTAHFHGGLDFRTQQREGLRVYSAAPGKIIRVSVSKVSYGKALYVRHANGDITLYAHLSEFSQPMKRLVKKAQKKSGRYETELTNLHIKTKPNKPIALSGNTGASGGPHLHFEIMRDTFRLNPACYGLPISDSAAPNLLYLALYSQRTPPDSSLVGLSLFNPDSVLRQSWMDAPALDYQMEKIVRKEYDSIAALLQQSADTSVSIDPPFLTLFNKADSLQWQASYFRTDHLPDTLFLHAATAFGICALDSIHRMPFHYGLYKLSFVVRDEINGQQDTLAAYELDRLPIAVFKDLDRHIDLPFYRKTGKRLEKSWLEPGQSRTPYRKMQNRGVFVPCQGKKYTLFIHTEDLAGNATLLQIPLVGKSR